ncbi:hypothetical protein V5O48_005516 [Marasmius crinis-equi]|uniref:Hemerythrin-like domain-containing protein n=1 Tax=Marasmius crinis-equi TaxID=585013 RepID=A0ABR3FM23_9AGAR
MSPQPQHPAPSDPYELFQWNMIRAHENFQIGLDRILQLVQSPPTDDISHFCGYLQAWGAAIHAHHETEEAFVFPFLSTKMNMKEEEGEHKAIHERLDRFLKYVAECKKDPKTFDGSRTTKMVEELRDVLLPHLNAEVEHIAPSNLREAGFSEQEMNELLITWLPIAIVEGLSKEARKHGDPFLVVPFMISHTPPEHRAFPEGGWFLKKVLVPFIFARRDKGYWKYSPYSMS